MKTTAYPILRYLIKASLFILILANGRSPLFAQCDTEVSGVFTYCNAIGTPGTTGYFVAFRVSDPTGDTLNVVDLNGNNVTNRGKRINDINTQNEPATVTVTPLMISGVGADTLEFWYFGPFTNDSSFNIALIDPSNTCDTIFVASGSYDCMDNTGISDPMACDNDVPLYFLDFSFTEFEFGGGGGGNESFDELFLIMQRSRENFCCDLQPPNQSCFEFIVRLGDEDIGLTIDDVGSGSPGGELYADTLNMFACTGVSATTWPFTQSGGQSQDLPLCLLEGSGQEFVVLSCKSGGNVTGASIDAISNLFVPPVVTIEPCNAAINVFNADTAFWSSPDDPELNNLISCTGDSIFCTFLYDTLTFGEVTSCEGDTFTYIVGATPQSNECFSGDTILYDTTFVVVYPTFSVSIDSACLANDSLLLTAVVSSAASGCEYAYQWSTGDTTASITVPFDMTEYFVTVTRQNVPEEAQNCVITSDSIIAAGNIVVDCSNITDTLYSCIDLLPPPDTTLVIVTGCDAGDPLIFVQDANNGGAGCIDDTLVITRYYIVDFDGDTVTTTADQDTCSQLLIFVDDIPPVAGNNCPADTTLDCSVSDLSFIIPPTYTDNCSDPENITVSFRNDTISGFNGACNNDTTGIIRRIWFGEDECGNVDSTCFHFIVFLDTVAPVITCLADLTVQCAIQVPDPEDPGSVTVSDNCSNVTVTATDIISNLVCANQFTITRTYTATDACGYTASCMQVITVFDSTSPSITCPADITVQCANQVPPADTAAVSVTDNCGGSVTVTIAPDVISSQTCVNQFIITRVYTATDDCGNSSTCAQTITVFDDTAPVITCPADITVQCASQVPAADTASVSVTDNCGGGIAVTAAPDVVSNQTCANRYTITRVYTATDECGNSATCAQIITVFDDTPPSITCPSNVTVQCANQVPSPDPSAVITSDNCGGTVTVTFAPDIISNQTCTNRFTVTRIYTATDECGNSATCAQIITVFDDTPPVIICPADTIVQCASQVPAANTSSVFVNDNCAGIIFVTVAPDVITNQTCTDRYTITRVYTATDVCGNSATCAQTITVFDDTPPALSCPSDVTVQCASQVPAPDINSVTASDNCVGPVTVSVEEDVISDQTCVNRFTITRVYTATDECGNSASCAQTITVFDDTPPSIVCPSDTVVECASQVPAADIGLITTTDNCAGTVTVTVAPDVISDFVCADSFTITRTYIATDECGNSATCAQIINVVDNTIPTITCPSDITVECADQIPDPDTAGIITSDNCGGPATVTAEDAITNQTCANEFILIRTYTATDSCGNTATCSQAITVFDNTVPVITCPADVTVQCTSEVPAPDPGTVVASDNCGGIPVVTVAPDVISNQSCTDRYTITRVYTATDECGNSTTCAQTITVFDDTPPVITCPSDVTVQCANQVPAPNTSSVTVTDNCGSTVNVTVAPDVISNQTCTNRFTITRVYTATDACGNSATCAQVITVFDDTPPVINCPANVTVQCASQVPASNVSSVFVNDNCAGIILVTVAPDVISNQTCTNRLTVTRVYTATDVCGNSATCAQIITVFDDTPPVLTCPADLTFQCASQVPPADIASVTASDNCGGQVTVTVAPDVISNQTCDNRFTITRIYTATDDCGNAATCAQTITVFDDTPPGIVCPANITVQCASQVPAPDPGAIATSDNCSGLVTVTVAPDIISNQTCTNRFTITRIYTASDDCGNTAICAQLITVFDDTPPSITCPSDVTVSCASEVPPVNTGSVSSMDNCGGAAIITHVSDVIANQTCPNNFILTRTYRATDECGNSSTCSQVITVSDNIPPSITCPPDITIDFTESSNPSDTGMPGGSDNCGGTPAFTFSDIIVPGQCAQEFTIQRTWTATDACGNTATCVQTISVTGCAYDLSLIKDLDPGQGEIEPGENVTFTVTITNEGDIPVGAVTITDYVPLGFTLNDPDWTPGMAGSSGQSASIALSVANGALPPGGLLPTQSVSVQITLLVNLNIIPGEYANAAEISFVFDIAGNDISDLDIDSTPDEDDLNDPDAEDDHDIAVVCIQPSPVIVGDEFVCPGEIVTYTVVPFNPNNTYIWTLQNGGGVIIENTGETITVQWQDAPGGAFVIQVTEIASSTCQATALFNVIIHLGETLACNDHINISLDADGVITLLPGMILEGEELGDDDYIVIIIDSNGDTLPDATLTCEHVGQIFTVKIMSECIPQSCWGTILVEDKLAPQITCECPAGNPDSGPECIITCLEVAQLISGNIPEDLQPEVVDNCPGATISIIDIDYNTDNCEGGFIHVTWKATDVAGNMDTCEQEFTIIPLTLDSLICPPNFLGECGSSTDPEITGWPQVNGININDDGGLCNLFTGYWDKELTECGGGRKIIRSWTILDWCTLELVECEQIIKLTDTEGPELTCPANITVGTDFWYCYANVSVPKPVTVDACSDISSFELLSSEGIVIGFGNNFVINGLEIGIHTVIWVVTDECGNSSSCSFTITVVDNVVPVANCDQHTIVSLANDGPSGITLVAADVFDDGSYDNCGPVTFRARRMDSCIDIDWTTEGACIDHIPGGIPPVNSRDRGTVHRPCVPFACCDVGAGPVMIELEVTDAAGNRNYCMVEATVQDKISPFIECPPDITVSCDYWFAIEEGTFTDAEGNNDGSLDEDPLTPEFGNMYDAFRYNENVRKIISIHDPANTEIPQPHIWGLEGWADDNCEVNLQVRVRIIDDCSGAALPANAPPGAVRLIERRFSASDGNEGVAPATCTQRIWVVDFDPFFITDNTCNNADPTDGVIWPCDVTLTTCPEDLSGTGEPQVFDDACSLIGVSFEDTRFDFADGACFKILREWKVIDWCQFDPNTGYGLWSYVQVIKVHDHDAPEFLDCPAGPVELCVEDPGVRLPASNQAFLGEDDPLASNCSVHVTLSHRIRETCSATIKYDVKFYPFNGAQFIQLKPFTTVTLDENHEGIISFDTEQSNIQSIRKDGLPYNSPWCGNYHRVLWTVEDGCGNLNQCEYLLRLIDCKQPSPVCINGLSTVVMPTSGQVTIWAKDFDASSFDDCTPADELLFSFSGDSYQPSFTYTCDNVPAFGVELSQNIWVADGGVDHNCNNKIDWEERNKDFCTTTIVVTDNENVCDTSGSILAGEIITGQSNGVGQVKVSLTDPDNNYPAVITQSDGKFSFDHLRLGRDYEIRVERNDNHRNGVSTLDLVRIQKHLLGIAEFNSPYQYIAADANNSGGVSAIDIVELRQLILGVVNELPRNQSWRFMEKKYQMPDSTNPWPIKDIITVKPMAESIYDNDFIGIKIGDVNFSAKANAYQIVPRSARPVLDIKVTTPEHVYPGETFDLVLDIPGIISGFQWTLETHGLEMAGILSDEIEIGSQHVGMHSNGTVTMSWNSDGKDVRDIRLRITFKAKSLVSPKSVIRLTSHVTEAEAYTADGEIMDVRLDYGGMAENKEFALYQNEPNPWENETLIAFDLPADAPATLTVLDVAGKLIKVIEGNYKAGRNTIVLEVRDLPSHGVLYYRLESRGNIASKKMVLLR